MNPIFKTLKISLNRLSYSIDYNLSNNRIIDKNSLQNTIFNIIGNLDLKKNI